MLTRSGMIAKYERMYSNGLMYLAKGEPLLAEKYLNEAALQLKEYIGGLCDEEQSEKRVWFLELCGHIKEIQKYYSTHKAKQKVIRSIITGSPDETLISADDIIEAISQIRASCA